VLADICGKPMIWHVYQGVSAAQSIEEIWIISDSQEVLDAAHSWGAKTALTSEDCPSGTDRIASVMDRFDSDIVVNVQGDEPLITGQVVDSVVQALSNSSADIATPVYRLKTLEELNNPNVVKVARASDGSAIYFSRSPVPHLRDVATESWLSTEPFWGHAGIYAFRRQVLEEFPKLPQGRLENLEKLEQLRLLEAGKRFMTVELDYRPHAVDVPEDLKKVQILLQSLMEGRDQASSPVTPTVTKNN
jgi:3-deoxy-manno-octulosonate cytidylyltransferase (CMP-KDO synthetase)